MFANSRKRLVEWVRQQLIGPPHGADQTLRGVLPTERFPCGALYPTSTWGDGIDPSGDPIEEAAGTPITMDESGVEPAIVRRYVPPSSTGFSFFITGTEIRLQVLARACRYERQERDERGRFKNDWTHMPLSGRDGEAHDLVGPEAGLHQRITVLQQRAHIDALWRRHKDGWIVTLTLCNAQQMSDETREYAIDRAEKALFEAELRCVIEEGEVGIYPRVDRSLLDEEEQEIEVQYVNRHIYAIGHGGGVEWDVDPRGVVRELRSNAMPSVEVPQVTADTGTGGDSTLSLVRLSNFERHGSVAEDLTAFVEGYDGWIADQRKLAGNLEEDDRQAGTRIVSRMSAALSRMRTGLDLLKRDEKVATAFALANRAMLDQMRQQDRMQGRVRSDENYRWRPFQLAFLLTVLESAVNEDSDFRDTVDLIWFPTGGGKTEAYLGLMALLIVLRRLRHPATGGGTTVLMRYTLRLLTRDQFLRASRLICALELIRCERGDLGAEPISIGLWVGDATSPNTYAKAGERIAEARSKDAVPALVVDRCPWCGSEFDLRNFVSGAQEFRFRCHSRDCAFGATGDGRIPCNVVDEALYDAPPTLLIATLDKFARLAWDERANAFFGGGTQRPPELVVQDELHLIAGALGSVAGLYEAALDTVIRLRGVQPKYIASTATIRMASQQVTRLYGRDLAVFPPPGLSCDDAYFARTVPVEKRPGRLYVGYLAPLLNRQECLAPLAASLLCAPGTLFSDQEEAETLLDAWWTQVVYHGSLKGVGNSHTAFSGDVRDFLRLLEADSSTSVQDSGAIDRSRPRIAQLTSLQTAEQNAEVFARLRASRSSDACLDAVLATNMVSVGLDVARLALMIVNGQPLTTAEYIQASSRVGRGDVSGIVFVNYYRDQARSLSHYEGFRSYHEAFYRFVEPTSVTPFTYQARLRALHAALVIVVRHSQLGLLGNATAANFDPLEPRVAAAVSKLALRCAQADQGSANEVRQHLSALTTEWQEETARCREARRQLEYQIKDMDNRGDRLLYNHDDRIPGLWATLQSMRQVENTALLKAL